MGPVSRGLLWGLTGGLLLLGGGLLLGWLLLLLRPLRGPRVAGLALGPCRSLRAGLRGGQARGRLAGRPLLLGVRGLARLRCGSLGIWWLRLPLGGPRQRPLALGGHVGLLIGRRSLAVGSGRGRWVGLPRVRRLPTLLSRGGLGVGRLLLARVRGLARLAIVLGLGLRPITSWSLLAIGSHLWSIRHAPHSCRSTSLHPHWVSLGTRGAVRLAGITWSLLGPGGRTLLRLLGVRTSCSVRLASHLRHRVHGTRRLVSPERLPGTSRAHRRRVMSSLLPSRVAAPVLTAAAHVRWSLISSFLAAVVAGRVVGVPPGGARGG